MVISAISTYYTDAARPPLPPVGAGFPRPGGETPPLPARRFFVGDRVRGGFAWFFPGAGLKPAPTAHQFVGAHTWVRPYKTVHPPAYPALSPPRGRKKKLGNSLKCRGDTLAPSIGNGENKDLSFEP
jgi:hypothetical protein